MDIKIEDDYCDKEVFKELKKLFADTYFPWYFYQNTLTENTSPPNWFSNADKDKLMDIKIEDDYCDKEVFNELKELYSNHNYFPWYYHKNKTVDPDDGLYQFVHVFYEINAPTSSWFPIAEKVLASKNPIYVRIKANLQPDTGRGAPSPFHTDMALFPGHTTSILYMNTNNGYTTFEESGQKIESVENRLVTFPSHLRHGSIESTDLPRIVMNFNYYG